jgi:predicted Zn-dependent protease with MMP-like domain
MGIAAAVILVLLVLVPTVVVLGLFVWAARKDGEEDRALQARLGIRRRTRLGRWVVSDHLDPAEQFEEYAQNAVDSLPPDLRGNMSNVEIVVEEEPPPGQPLLGLYQGVPLTRRSSHYGGALPDKITLYRGPLMRLYGQNADLLRREVRRVVLHEIAHHFGISDERLIEIDRYWG